MLAGPSGSGKSRLAARLGLPALRLDNFYRDHTDPDMPQSSLGIIDWDDPDSWDYAAALAAIIELCHHGRTRVPSYDIDLSCSTGFTDLVTVDRRFIAEGLFATTVIEDCRSAGILDAAICVRHHRLATFVLRFSRDLREGRKPPHVLIRRGWRLLRAEPAIVADAVAHGCMPMTPRQAERLLRPRKTDEPHPY